VLRTFVAGTWISGFGAKSLKSAALQFSILYRENLEELHCQSTKIHEKPYPQREKKKHRVWTMSELFTNLP
jgi:hypothetical protein